LLGVKGSASGICDKWYARWCRTSDKQLNYVQQSYDLIFSKSGDRLEPPTKACVWLGMLGRFSLQKS